MTCQSREVSRVFPLWLQRVVSQPPSPVGACTSFLAQAGQTNFSQWADFMAKTSPDKNEIVTRRAPRWAWQAVDMFLAAEMKARLPYKAVRHSTLNPEVPKLTVAQAQDLVRREDLTNQYR